MWHSVIRYVFTGALSGFLLNLGQVRSSSAQERSVERAVIDRVIVRFYAPEAGGAARPRFMTERQLAFETRLEALAEQQSGAARSTSYPERFVRAALERHIAEEILAILLIEQGKEPLELPKLVIEERQKLAIRVGGESQIVTAAAAEGISQAEIDEILRRKVRAAYSIDHTVTPILHPSEEQLREVYRTGAHPYRKRPFDEIRSSLTQWFVDERFRVAVMSYSQTIRSHVKVSVIPGASPVLNQASNP